MQPGDYRTRLFLDLFHLLALPSLALTALLYRFDIRLGWILPLPSYTLFIILWAFCKGLITRLVHANARYRLGAKEIPCVRGKWPGNIDVLLKMMKSFKTSYLLDVYLQLFEEYQCTTLNTRILWSDTIITMDQEHTKYIMATGFNHFWRGKYQKERMEKFLGQGIFNRDDEMWRMHRANTRPFFARERISDFETFETYSSRTLSIISDATSADQPFDAQDLFSRFTIDAASDFLFGKNLDTLSASLPTPGKTTMSPKGSATGDSWGSFTHAFEMAQQVATGRGRLGRFWPLFELFGDKNAKNARIIHDWVDPLVKDALSEKARMMHAGVVSPIAEKNFLQHLTESTDDPVLIRDQLLSLLLASRDTTACLLTYVTYFMAIYPEVAQKLRAEVLQHCGVSNMPTYDQIRELKYMRAVINETLRLFPPVPLNVRECRHSCTLPPSDPTYNHSGDQQQLYIPSGTPVMFFPLLIQRNAALWGADADRFDPNRWIDPARISHFVANPTMFTPFSAGPRICVGQNYAYNEASYFLVKLLQQFESFSLAPDAQPSGSLPPEEWKHRKGRQSEEKIWPGSALTLFVKGGLWVRFHKAQTS